MAGIFNASIFNSAIFNTGGVVSPVVVVETLQPAGRGASSPAARRRRYIMPDGTMVYATTDEAFAMLRDFSAPISTPQPQVPVTLQKREVRFLPAEDAMPDTWKAVIPERFAYEPPPETRRQAEIIANRMRADEEAILALIL
jgi:hypothetical protein